MVRYYLDVCGAAYSVFDTVGMDACLTSVWACSCGSPASAEPQTYVVASRAVMPSVGFVHYL